MDVPVLNQQGSQVGTMSVDEASLGSTVNPDLIKQAYVRYHANLRQGSARTKNRSRVEGSTRKIYRQKGTGNARMGTVRTSIRRGGGRTFAKLKTREEYRVDMPVKMRRLANRNALLAKLIDNEVRVIDDLSFDSPKTSRMGEMLKALKIDRSCVLALNAENENARRGARNLEDVSICNAAQLTCWDLLNHRYVVIAKSDLEAWLGGPSSVTDKSYSRTSVKAAAGSEAA